MKIFKIEYELEDCYDCLYYRYDGRDMICSHPKRDKRLIMWNSCYNMKQNFSQCPLPEKENENV